jgi:hypothetical protein
MDPTNSTDSWNTFPDWEFDTYWTIGMTSGDAVGQLPIAMGMPNGDEICSGSTNDGVLYVMSSPPNSLAGENLRVLIAQVTTCGDWSLQTCIQTFVNAEPSNTYITCPDLLEVVHPYLNGECVNDSDGDGVCDELEIGGCTDSEACNYDVTATDENASCIFIGDTCDDGDPNTVDDEIQEDCECAGTSNTIVDELEALSVLIYPNPTSNNLTVDLGNLTGVNTSIKLYDSSSKLVFEKQSSSTLMIDVSVFAKGLYTLELSTSDKVLRSQVVVE